MTVNFDFRAQQNGVQGVGTTPINRAAGVLLGTGSQGMQNAWNLYVDKSGVRRKGSISN